MNTKSCATMLFYKSSPYYTGAKICPRYTIDPLDVDSCTSKPYSSGVSCSTFCESFPGLTCLDGIQSLGDSCMPDRAWGKLGCDATGDYWKLW